MSKINDIIISNFKFFSEAKTIHLGGKHLLLYGENGSGKSSIFWGLYTLLEASYKNAVEIEKYFLPLDRSEESLVNIYAPLVPAKGTIREHSDSYIKITDEYSNTYELSLLNNKICGDTNAQESRKASDFINYQSIFKFQDFRNSETPDLCDIFKYSILPYVSFSSFTKGGKNFSNAGQMLEEYEKGPDRIKNKKGVEILVYKSSPQYKEFCNFENHFNLEFEKLIDYINIHAKERLKGLGYDIDFKLVYGRLSHIKKDKHIEKTPFRIELSITKYNGKSVSIKRPHVFLNEAKLSALATAIRLTILDYRVGPDVTANALKVLVLDDLMISLDMSNRVPLLDLILNEYSKKYQILFLTHDKNLYGFVVHKIKQNGYDDQWLKKEMYVGVDDAKKQDFPVIIDEKCDPIEKAKKYLLAKDYTVSALFLRQSLEKQIGELLPLELMKKADGGFVSLQELWKRLKDFYQDNANPIEDGVQKLFEDSKLLVLNPSAHFQRLSNPIYKNELTNAFELYEKLKKIGKIDRKLVVEKGKVFTFKYKTSGGKLYECSLELENNLEVIEGDRLISVMPKCKNISWKYDDVEFYDFVTKRQNLGNPLINSTPKLNNFINGLTKLPLGITEDIFMKNCLVDGISLDDYCLGTKISSLIVLSVEV